MIKVVAMLAIGLTLSSGVADSKCSNGPSNPQTPRKVNPAPNPDPAPHRSGIGNVSITFWLDQDAHRTITTFNVGKGHQTHYCNNDCHWSATAKPGQVVTSTTDYYKLGQKGWLKIQVIQNNNGRILCQDDNADNGRSGGVTCTGTVVI